MDVLVLATKPPMSVTAWTDSISEENYPTSESKKLRGLLGKGSAVLFQRLDHGIQERDPTRAKSDIPSPNKPWESRIYVPLPYRTSPVQSRSRQMAFPSRSIPVKPRSCFFEHSLHILSISSIGRVSIIKKPILNKIIGQRIDTINTSNTTTQYSWRMKPNHAVGM